MCCAKVATKYRWSGFLLIIVLALGHQRGFADEPIQSELQNIRTANQAMQDVVAAQLALARFNVDQLKKLQGAGHAAWLETARQQVLADQLIARQKSLAEFTRFIETVNGRIEGLNRPLRHTASLVKVYMQGSNRLVGWIETSTEFIDSQPRKAGSSESGLATAQSRFQRYEKICRNLTESAPATWTTQAHLQRNVAAAELNLLNTQLKLIPNEGPISEIRNDAALSAIGTAPIFTASAMDELFRATKAIARAEANSTGDTNHAQIELLRSQRRFELANRLVSGGISSDRTRSKAQLKVADASFHLDSTRQIHAMLQDQLDRLGKTGDDTKYRRVQAEKVSARVSSDCDWPDFVLTDFARTVHLIDLSRSRFDIRARQQSKSVQLRMKQEMLRRLEDAIARTSPTNPVSSAAVELKAKLESGEQRQVETLRLDIDSLSAEIRSLQEKTTVLYLEETRFIAQCKHQDPLARPTFTLSRPLFRGVGTIPGHSRPSTSNGSYRFRANYLERRDLFRSDESLVCLAAADPHYFDFDLNCSRRGPLMHVGGPASLTAKSVKPSGVNRRPWLNNPALLPSRVDPCLPSFATVPLHGWYVNEPGFVLETYSTRDIYPHGILRQDLRDRIPAGFPPWYLPGIPTNLQK